jgi:formylglycine-generating enzyme required for sulfatase activity
VKLALALVAAAIAASVAVAVARRGSDDRARCGGGFVARAARCVPASAGACPAPLVVAGFGAGSACDAPDVRVLVPATSVVLGPSDWEAEGRVAPRTVHAGPFRIDAFEVTRGAWARAGGAPVAGDDAARAVSGVSLEAAEAFCARRGPGGRLPTEDEWIAAAVAGARTATRYPWGDTGAVCRRAAWGLGAGPCADAGDGPDTVGAHPDGDSALGLHDMAGNAAEWVEGAAPPAAWAKGGSWETALATELRIWARLELPASAGDPRVGFRCVFSP